MIAKIAPEHFSLNNKTSETKESSDFQNNNQKIKHKKCVLYIFSWGKNEYAEEFGSETIEVKDIPEPILKIYKQIQNQLTTNN